MKQSIAAFALLMLLVANPGSAQNTTPQNTDSAASHAAGELLGAPLARDPIFVYNNWSAYDELSDNIPLTERLAMKELDEILRLRRFGVRFDYYMMDAFWFDRRSRLSAPSANHG